LFFFLASAGADEGPRQELVRHCREAVEARTRGDLPAFLEHAQAALELSPEHPYVLDLVAHAWARNGRPAKALSSLRRLAELGVSLDAATDADLEVLQGQEGFDEVLHLFADLDAPLGDSAVAFSLGARDLVTEGITYDPASGDFFVSSVHHRKIVRVPSDGREQDFVAEASEGLLAVLGIAVDPPRRRLWACTAAVSQMLGYQKDLEGRTELVGFDLESGRRLLSLGPPQDGARHSFNDLTLAGDGTVYVSDSVSGALYRLTPDAAELEVLVEPGRLLSPNGLTLSADQRRLFISDYPRLTGLAVLQLDTRTLVFPTHQGAPTLYGIDGLRRHGETLIAIQNGVRPHRVLRLRLDPDLSRVAEVRVLEKANPHFDEPTLGVMVGDRFYYVANSQWGSFDEDGRIWPENRLEAPVVLSLRP
jgi:hypothetical protein